MRQQSLSMQQPMHSAPAAFVAMGVCLLAICFLELLAVGLGLMLTLAKAHVGFDPGIAVGAVSIFAAPFLALLGFHRIDPIGWWLAAVPAITFQAADFLWGYVGLTAFLRDYSMVSMLCIAAVLSWFGLVRILRGAGALRTVLRSRAIAFVALVFAGLVLLEWFLKLPSTTYRLASLLLRGWYCGELPVVPWLRGTVLDVGECLSHDAGTPYNPLMHPARIVPGFHMRSYVSLWIWLSQIVPGKLAAVNLAAVILVAFVPVIFIAALPFLDRGGDLLSRRRFTFPVLLTIFAIPLLTAIFYGNDVLFPFALLLGPLCFVILPLASRIERRASTKV